MKYDVIIVASGKGERANLGYNKVFYKMKNGKTVLEQSVELFLEDNDCVNIIVVTNEECLKLVLNNNKIIKTIGGEQRKDSVKNGLKLVSSEYVLIHDGARPFLNAQSLSELKIEIEKHGAAILAKKAVDTVKKIQNNKIIKTIDRNTIYLAETPQGFKTDLIKKCYEKCGAKDFTDDASLVESFGYDVFVVEDRFDNKKLTTETDFVNL